MSKDVPANAVICWLAELLWVPTPVRKTNTIVANIRNFSHKTDYSNLKSNEGYVFFHHEPIRFNKKESK